MNRLFLGKGVALIIYSSTVIACHFCNLHQYFRKRSDHARTLADMNFDAAYTNCELFKFDNENNDLLSSENNAAWRRRTAGIFAKCLRLFAIFPLLLSCGIAFSEPIFNDEIFYKGVPDSEILIRKSGSERRCVVDTNSVDIKLSSDGQSVILSGTSFVQVEDLMQCDPEKVVHTKLAASHIGFLSDVNLRAGLYVSLVPIAVNPMSFLAVVAKIGSGKNIVDLPGFYRAGIPTSRMLHEASSNMHPVISLDGRYVSLYLYSCGSNGYVDVFEILLKKKTRIDHASCERLFNFQ
ncbi:hypothetical protein ACAX43_02545 [Paraburkholderia sp. IW21]|uniref:hypothetical protein n=1 Tax=Paraburkholderia sp. IW21 TaxID=3242488 RepID=UPI003520F2F7